MNLHALELRQGDTPVSFTPIEAGHYSLAIKTKTKLDLGQTLSFYLDGQRKDLVVRKVSKVADGTIYRLLQRAHRDSMSDVLEELRSAHRIRAARFSPMPPILVRAENKAMHEHMVDLDAVNISLSGALLRAGASFSPAPDKLFELRFLAGPWLNQPIHALARVVWTAPQGAIFGVRISQSGSENDLRWEQSIANIEKRLLCNV